MFNRRKFLKVVGTASALLAFPVSLVWAKGKKLSLSIEKVKVLKDVGGSKLLKIKKKPILFIRDSEKSILAFDPTCPHKKCDVAYNKEKNRIECPCHKSYFDLTGKRLEGPATAPLKAYEATLEEGKIKFSLE